MSCKHGSEEYKFSGYISFNLDLCIQYIGIKYKCFLCNYTEVKIYKCPYYYWHTMNKIYDNVVFIKNIIKTDVRKYPYYEILGAINQIKTKDDRVLKIYDTLNYHENELNTFTELNNNIFVSQIGANIRKNGISDVILQDNLYKILNNTITTLINRFKNLFTYLKSIIDIVEEICEKNKVKNIRIRSSFNEFKIIYNNINSNLEIIYNNVRSFMKDGITDGIHHDNKIFIAW